LFILRGLHGLGFGGEWATGAVLMGEVIRDKYRGRGVGFVQTGAAVGPGLAALVYAGLYAILPEAIAWRALFAVGILPALLVLWIRRSIPESEAFEGRRKDGARPGIAHLLSAFRGQYLWLTIKVSLMVMGAQGGVWAVNFWMPTYLRTVRHLSASNTGLYVVVQACGVLVGFLLGAYLADAIGRKWTFMISAVASIIMVLVYLYLPVGDTGLLLLGIPLNAAILMKFAPMGGSSLISITVLSVTPMRAGKLFALASVEIDIDGVWIEVRASGRCASPLVRPGWNSRRSAMPQANRARRLSCPTKSRTYRFWSCCNSA
jgi:MFS family permease